MTNTFELSPQQERLWLAEPDGPRGCIQARLRLSGALDPAALERALGETVTRHEILRTTFVRSPGIRYPLQAVAPALAPAFAAVDISDLDPEAQVQRLEELEAAERSADFDLERGPLVRACLAALGPDAHVLVLTISALCADAASVAALARELAAHYAGAPLTEDPLQYADFAAWQRELDASDDDEAQATRELWSAARERATVTLPFARPGAPARAPERVTVHVEEDVTAALRAQAERFGTGLVRVVQATWQAVLARSAGAPELAVALLTAERRHGDLDGALGTFARPVPVGARTGLEVSFPELLSEVARISAAAPVWQDYSPDGATPELGFVEAAPVDVQTADVHAQLEALRPPGNGLRVWLTCLDGASGLSLAVDHDPGYLDGVGAQRLADRLACMLVAVGHDATAALGALELLSADERRELLDELGQGGEAPGGPPVQERFSALAASAPERLAVIDEHQSITYGELDRRANQLAQRLARAGVGPGRAAGLCTERSLEMVIGLLGILKTGGAYVPLHPDNPPARLAQQLQTAGAVALVTHASLLDHFAGFAGELVCLDRDRDELAAEPAAAPDVSVARSDLAYVIFTSGSTGTPKGVGVTHANLSNYAAYISGRLVPDGEPLTFALVTSVATDLGNTAIFGALWSGGTLVVATQSTTADAGALSRLFRRVGVDVIKITPSHLGALLAGGDGGILPRRWLVLGGERASWELIDQVGQLGVCSVLNHYGPTEATIGCCTFPLASADRARESAASVPIGRPISGATCYVLDDERRPVPLGAPGRLYVGGVGVAQGYAGAPELTAERFLADPFAGGEGRMYDTGDVVRWTAAGALEFLGRVDEQVKIRGYRVEPAEVESALRAGEHVREAVVLARPGAGGELRLVAYVTTDAPVSRDALRDHLAGWLPEYMLPAAIVILDGLPLTPSGKVDRLALPDPGESEDAGAEYLAPRTPVEQAVADIWARVLGLPRVSVEEDFFALGGHSLLATQVVAQVRSDFAVDLPLHSLFTYPTVASLAEEIVRMMGDSEDEETARLMAELEGLSDEEAERLLAGETPPQEA